MADSTSIEAPQPDPPTAAVLIVDDDPAKRLAIRSILEPLGHTVVEADSGRAALRAVLRATFAVILMDVRMPIMDGFETAKLIRQRSQSRRTPIIFVTAFGRDETETASAYASGAVDFIFTPILDDVLQAKVSAFVDLYLQAQELQSSLASITALNTALHDSEMRAHAVLQNVADAIVTASEGGIVIESFNRSARRLFGYTEQEVVGRPLKLIVAESHHARFCAVETLDRREANPKDLPGEPIETLGRRKDGSHFPMEMGLSEMELGNRTFTIACIRDISGRQAYDEAISHQTLHDDLTGLPNRTLFGDRMDRTIAAADRAEQPSGVLLVGLDAFNEVNQTFGRAVGDVLLQAVAQRLLGTVRESDTIARVGGDTFGILPSGETAVETAAVMAWKIRETLGQPFLIDGNVIDVRASIGIALFPEHGRTTTDLLGRADRAMRSAKRSGRGLAVFAATPDDDTARRMTLLSDLRDGIARDELVLHFQPKIGLTSPPQTTGVEALVRWQHPTDGLLMPAQFMPEAERSELIEPLTKWVLDAALRQQHLWHEAGLDLTMAVNISGRSLTLGSDLPDSVAKLTAKWHIPPGMLILELTENALIDANVPDVLEHLHAMGERLSIDDFGTGHSSLVYLQRLPIDEIKIDQSFVTNLATVPNDAVIVRSTIELAHNLGLSVVTEGVEDEEALGMLAEYGCDSAQGYFFSRPCSAHALTAWFAASPFGMRAAVGR
jgi:diguanylate cyclase (GGDEF)-like protein/PAS domain S-box-containing protein